MIRQRLASLYSRWRRATSVTARAVLDQARFVVDERIRRRQVRRLEQALRAFMSPMDFVKEDPIGALQSPRTTMARIRDGARQVAAQTFGSQEAVIEFLRTFVEAIPKDVDVQLEERLRHSIVKARQLVSASAEGANLLALYDEANAKGPLTPFLFVSQHPSARDPIDQLAAERALLALGSTEKEVRALRLFDAVPDLVEKVYGSYLRSLWSLSHLAEGSWPPAPHRDFGGLVQMTSARLAHFSGLIDADAGRLRNAVQHRQAEYLPGSDEILFRNQRNPAVWDPGAWQVTLRLNDFETRLLQMRFVSIDVMALLRDVATLELLQQSGMLQGLPALRAGLRTGDLSAAAPYFDNESINRLLARQRPPPSVDLWFFSMPQSEKSQ